MRFLKIMFFEMVAMISQDLLEPNLCVHLQHMCDYRPYQNYVKISFQIFFLRPYKNEKMMKNRNLIF